MTILYLSPHPDDAVFSAGGAIARAVAAGERVVVATVFSASAEDEAGRRSEDRAAVARLGAERVALDLPEAPRRDRAYRRPGRMFAPIGEAEAELVSEIGRSLGELARGLGEDVEVVAPLGVGEHVDHQLVYAAAAAAFPPSATIRRAHYEDIPYALCRYAVGRRLARLGGAPASAPRAGRLVEAWALARFWGETPYVADAIAWAVRPIALAVLAMPVLRAYPSRVSSSPDGHVKGLLSTGEPSRAMWREERVDVSAHAGAWLAAIAEYRTQHPLFLRSLAAWRGALAEHARRMGSPVLAVRRWRP